MVTAVSILPREGEVTLDQVEPWLNALAAHRSAKDLQRLRAALAEVAQQHAGQSMVDGTGKLLALVQTADILDGLKLDIETLLTALLSELPGAPGYDRPQVVAAYGERVAGMLDLVSRIRDLSATGTRDGQADDVEALRRLLLGLADDVRVLLVVLAKRLRLMRGLKHLPPEGQRRVARETQLVHAPLANRLGVWQMKWELEDLCLRYLEPETYKDLAKRLDGKRREREDFIANVIGRLQAECQRQGIHAEISGRPKHIYSIWKKMQRKGVGFEQVFDVRAVRVLVDTVA
ncbi:MAG: hypothetical protein RLZ44_502, partial [Pseudomonadota bacterium]